MNENELQPWVVVTQDDSGTSLAMWQIKETGQPALTLFSTQALADNYAASINRASSVMMPTRPVLLNIMIECYQQGIALAVLDPTEATARKIFNLADVLRAAREELKGWGA